MPRPQGLEAQLLIWVPHVVPVNPGAQVQLNLLRPFVQVAPFAHGVEAQLLMMLWHIEPV